MHSHGGRYRGGACHWLPEDPRRQSEHTGNCHRYWSDFEKSAHSDGIGIGSHRNRTRHEEWLARLSLVNFSPNLSNVPKRRSAQNNITMRASTYLATGWPFSSGLYICRRRSLSPTVIPPRSPAPILPRITCSASASSMCFWIARRSGRAP